MKTITLLTAEELKERFPDGYAKARAAWAMDAAHWEIPWQHEIFDSLKSVCRACGVVVKDWSIGPHDGRSFIRCAFPRDELEAIQGRRAMAWLENNLTGPLRSPHGPATLRQRAYGHRVGRVPPCPFTGVCFDEDFLGHLRSVLREGRNLKDAFAGLAAVASELMERELDCATSEESFANECDFAQHLFTEHGQRVIV